MAVFGRKASDSDADEAPKRKEVVAAPVGEERRQRAWIGSAVVIQGDLNSSEDLTIAGRLEGDVVVPKNTVVIAPSATVQGDVNARVVVVHGAVKGSITARERIELGEKGSVDGEIHTLRMKVTEGAKLNGRIRIGR